jgi:hypothetical protein
MEDDARLNKFLIWKYLFAQQQRKKRKMNSYFSYKIPLLIRIIFCSILNKIMLPML